jgi:hypothetical protein
VFPAGAGGFTISMPDEQPARNATAIVEVAKESSTSNANLGNFKDTDAFILDLGSGYCGDAQ